MLKIRLARIGRKKRPFFRVVLTEHTKSPQAGYKDILGTYNPLTHDISIDVDAVKEWIGKGAQPSERVAKLAFKQSKDDFFEKFFVERERVKKTKNPDKYE